MKNQKSKVTDIKDVKTIKTTPASKVTEVMGKSKKDKTKAHNATVVAKKITDKKDLMYQYPAEADNLEKRKKFRTQARAAVKQLTKRISTLKQLGRRADPAEKKQLMAEVHKFAQTKLQVTSPDYKKLMAFA